MVGVHEIELLQRPQRLLVAVKFGIEVDVPEGTAFAVAAAGPLHSQRDVTMPGQVADHPGESAGLADWGVDREATDTPLKHHYGGVPPFRFRAGDDGPQPHAVTRHRAVDHVVPVSLLAE